MPHAKVHLLDVNAPRHGIVVDPSPIFLGFSLQTQCDLVHAVNHYDAGTYQCIAISLKVNAGIHSVPARTERRLEVSTT